MKVPAHFCKLLFIFLFAYNSHAFVEFAGRVLVISLFISSALLVSFTGDWSLARFFHMDKRKHDDMHFKAGDCNVNFLFTDV